MNSQSKQYCGIDVSKKKLDVYFNGKVKQYDNTIKGIEKLSIWVKDAHYILESTGGYERAAAESAEKIYFGKSTLIKTLIRQRRIQEEYNTCLPPPSNPVGVEEVFAFYS